MSEATFHEPLSPLTESWEQYRKRVFDFADMVQRGDTLRDTRDGRQGRYTGEQQTSFPPNFGVTYEDGASGFIPFAHVVWQHDLSPAGEATKERDAIIARDLTAQATALGAIAAHPPPRFAIDDLDALAMRNMMVSMQAMAQAQLKRFDAAGVLAIVFDATGQAVMALERPDHHGVTDEYVRMALCNLGAGEPMKRSKPKKRKR